MRLWRPMLHEAPLGIMSLLLIMKLVLRAIDCGTGPGTCVEERSSFLVRRFEDENSRLARVGDDCLIAGQRQGSQPKGVRSRGQGSSLAHPVRLRGRRSEIEQLESAMGGHALSVAALALSHCTIDDFPFSDTWELYRDGLLSIFHSFSRCSTHSMGEARVSKENYLEEYTL